VSEEAGEAVEVAGETGLFKPLEHLLFEACGTKLPGRPDFVDDPGILPTVSKQPKFLGENEPGEHNYFWTEDEPAKAVTYLDESERAHLQLFVRDGKLYDAEGNLFDTSGARGARAIWVMDKNGNLYASNYREDGIFHHSSMLGGGPAAGAGEIEVSNGVMISISDKSGHYLPTRAFTLRAVGHLRSQGLPIDDSQIVFRAKT
jgi:hypothetical protein